MPHGIRHASSGCGAEAHPSQPRRQLGTAWPPLRTSRRARGRRARTQWHATPGDGANSNGREAAGRERCRCSRKSCRSNFLLLRCSCGAPTVPCAQRAARRRAQSRCRCGRGKPPSPGADVDRGEPSPLANVGGVSPVPVQTFIGMVGRTESRCRCGGGGPSPGADVAGASPAPVQTRSPGAPVRRISFAYVVAY